MPHHKIHKIHKEIVKNFKEKHALEPESSFEDRLNRRSQSRRRIGKSNIGKDEVADLQIQNLKIPQVPEKIVDLVNILRHKNFLKVVDQYFKPDVNNRSWKKSTEA